MWAPYLFIEVENAADRSGDHLLFVRAEDANPHPADDQGKHNREHHEARRIQLDTEEVESLAYARTNGRRVFADAAGEDQRIDPAQRRGMGADLFLRLIAD